MGALIRLVPPPGHPARTSMVTVDAVVRYRALCLMRRHPRLLKTFADALTVVRRQAGLEVRRG